MTKLTMEDVARAAGVNKATVSRALKGDPRITPATRERVWTAAKNLGYRLDITARSLSGGKTGLVVVVIESVSPWFSPHFFTGLNRVLAKAGMEILLKMPGFNDHDITASLTARHVDCILWAGGEGSVLPAHLNLPAVPLLTAGFSVAEIPAVLISEDDTLARLRTIASGRPLRLASGASPIFPFLSRVIRQETTSAESFFWILDGISHEELNLSSGCICALPEERRQRGFYHLEWPAFEMGVALGRILLKAAGGRGTFPSRTLLVPRLRDPSGEKLLFEKVNQSSIAVEYLTGVDTIEES